VSGLTHPHLDAAVLLATFGRVVRRDRHRAADAAGTPSLRSCAATACARWRDRAAFFAFDPCASAWPTSTIACERAPATFIFFAVRSRSVSAFVSSAASCGLK
jgi:hypothetical protein